jgi:hypothetical protein
VNRSIHKQAGIGLAAAALALLLLVNGCSGLSRSPHSGPPSEDIACLTEQHQYPEGTRSITIQVVEQGDFRGELDKPYLEVERSGQWYVLPKQSSENEPANLLFVSGRTEWEIGLAAYDLGPGQYRAVFDYWGGDGYFAFPFEVVEAE